MKPLRILAIIVCLPFLILAYPLLLFISLVGYATSGEWSSPNEFLK